MRILFYFVLTITQAEKLQRLCDTVSSTYTNSDAPPQTPNRSLLIDLGQFWEILEYSSSSEIPALARRLFGPSLYSASIPTTHEISHASSLPEPTRVDRQDFEGSGPNSVNTSVVNLGNGTTDQEQEQEQEFVQPPFHYSDDELAVLAESFFHQRGDGMGHMEDWWSTGNFS